MALILFVAVVPVDTNTPAFSESVRMSAVGHWRTLSERLFSARIIIGRRILETKMKAFIGSAAIIVALATVTSAEAKGCFKGAVVGGVAGHYSGHHGLLGAAAGCAIGRHEANKHDRMERNQIDKPNRDLRNGEERL
jgi:hypothetical protein